MVPGRRARAPAGRPAGGQAIGPAATEGRRTDQPHRENRAAPEQSTMEYRYLTRRPAQKLRSNVRRIPARRFAASTIWLPPR
jgi:hypothetical protein